MFELDERLTDLREASRTIAAELREHALAVDADPDDMAPHVNLFAYRMIRASNTPRSLRDEPFRLGRWEYESGSCLQSVVSLVELARGDAGMVLACPGPALAGILVDRLGTPAQQELFHRSLAGGRTWAFFAMTEPGRGNDATGMQTRLEKDGADTYRLFGQKRYIGNGSRGGVGVVFARTGPGPLSIRAVLVTVPPGEVPGFAGRPLDMVGLRGARLAELDLDGFAVPADRLLGEHLPPTRRGMWGALRTFNNMRVQVAAMAVGTGLALHDLVVEHRPGAPGAPVAAARLGACRDLVYQTAAAVDEDPDAGHRSSSAKLAATALGVRVARWAARSLGPAAMVDLPLLEKWSRDIRSFEFMEGTGNIQRGHVARAYLQGRSA